MNSGLRIPWREERAEFFAAAVEVGFDGAEWAGEHRGDFGMGEALLIMQVKGGLFVGGEREQRLRDIRPEVAQRRGGRLGFETGQMVLIERHGALAAAGITPMIVRDAEQPSGERGTAMK